jgi:hypothetical protein
LAKHLALEHLQASDLAFDRSLTPGQRHRCVSSGVVRAESSGETTAWLEATGGRARQPRIEFRWLALTDEAGEILRQCHRLCQLGRLLGQMRQLSVVSIRKPEDTLPMDAYQSFCTKVEAEIARTKKAGQTRP